MTVPLHILHIDEWLTFFHLPMQKKIGKKKEKYNGQKKKNVKRKFLLYFILL